MSGCLFVSKIIERWNIHLLRLGVSLLWEQMLRGNMYMRCRIRVNLKHTDMENETGRMFTHTDSEIVCVCEESLKANAETGDIAVGGGQTNFEHSLQWSYYPSSLEVTAEAAGKAPRTGGKKKLLHAELTEHDVGRRLVPQTSEKMSRRIDLCLILLLRPKAKLLIWTFSVFLHHSENRSQHKFCFIIAVTIVSVFLRFKTSSRSHQVIQVTYFFVCKSTFKLYWWLIGPSQAARVKV